MRRLRARRPETRSVAPLGAVGPDSVEVGTRTLRVGEGVCRTFAVTGYPREVGPGWLEPLLTHPGRAEVAVHVAPIPPALAADRLRRQAGGAAQDLRVLGDVVHPVNPDPLDDASDESVEEAEGHGAGASFSASWLVRQ